MLGATMLTEKPGAFSAPGQEPAAMVKKKAPAR
jgi:hypothetical protein